jgi:amino-acid N-acetyltransferase
MTTKQTTQPKKKKSKNGEVRVATVKDAAQIQAVILPYAKKDLILARSLNEIYENIRDFVVIENKGKIVACGALHVCWEDLAEIKSLAVTPRNKRKGYGKKIVEHFFEEADTLGIPKVFALTYQVEFFKAMGLRKVDMNSLPKKIWVDCIKCVRFNCCNETAMVIEL